MTIFINFRLKICQSSVNRPKREGDAQSLRCRHDPVGWGQPGGRPLPAQRGRVDGPQRLHGRHPGPLDRRHRDRGHTSAAHVQLALAALAASAALNV